MNQQAFPTEVYDGMTLRDYFAGQALTGLLVQNDPDDEYDPEMTAIRAYLFADALIDLRKEKMAARSAIVPRTEF